VSEVANRWDPATLRHAALGAVVRLRSQAGSIATWASVVACLGLAVLVRTYAFMASPALRYPDTGGYLEVANAPFPSMQWWAGIRSATVPLAYRLAGGAVAPALVLQLVLACFAWSVLALVVMRAVRTAWLKPVAVGLVLAFSLSREITQWDRIALSDSISLSLVALLVAALILYAERPGWLSLAALLVLGLLWAFARTPNGYELLFVVPVLAVTAVARPTRRAPDGVAMAGLLAVFVLSTASTNAGLRWEAPFYNVMDRRILPDATAVSYFAERGMPVTTALRRQTNRLGQAANEAYYRAELRPVRTWVLAHGQEAYVTFLLTHPGEALLDPAAQLADLLSENGPIRRYAPGAWEPLNGALSAWLFPDGGAFGVLVAGVLGVGAAAMALVGWRRRLLVPALLVAAAVPFAILIYHGDAGEVPRHELIPDAQVRLGLWLLLLLSIDVIAVGAAVVRKRRAAGAAT
jgi:hypothetical protein